MEEKYIVYLHINKTNNKVYVGITRSTKNPNRRWRNGMYGKHVSDYVKKLISDKFSKPVLQLDLNNNIINRFSSASEAERYLNGRGSHIGCCCLGKRKTAYGYKWKYE